VAEVSMTIEATPEEIFAVLLDAWSYEDWVVGCKDIRSVDETWPGPGARLHHTVGVGPVEVQDSTAVVEVDPPRRLTLEARAEPAGVARVVFTLEPGDGVTEVTMFEKPIRGVAATVDNAAFDKVVEGRNVETLRRLKKRVEEQAGSGR
jgi:uncharacterized protein YndB with AHSA1/START domain